MRGDEANDKEVAAIRAALSSRRIHLSMILEPPNQRRRLYLVTAGRVGDSLIYATPNVRK